MKDWKQLERHPLSAAYKDITGTAWKRFVTDLTKHGIVNGRCVTLLDGKVWDGWQLQRACIEANIQPEYRELKLPEGMDPEEAIQIVNDNRRHESTKQVEQRVRKRRARVAAARRKGQSTRAIAEEEGVSQQQVLRDLAATTDTGVSVEPEAGKVVGRDGVERPATASLKRCRACRTGVPNPLCSECKALNGEREPGDDTESEKAARAKKAAIGKPLFDWKEFDKIYGPVVRAVDAIGKPYAQNNSPKAEGLRRLLGEWREQLKAWQVSLKKGSG